jgi:cobalt-zinc-cadmium resistance protein CzcA
VAFFALRLTGIPLSVSGAIGFIVLPGQVGLDGSCFNQLQDEGLRPCKAVMGNERTRTGGDR